MYVYIYIYLFTNVCVCLCVYNIYLTSEKSTDNEFVFYTTVLRTKLSGGRPSAIMFMGTCEKHFGLTENESEFAGHEVVVVFTDIFALLTVLFIYNILTIYHNVCIHNQKDGLKKNSFFILETH